MKKLVLCPRNQGGVQYCRAHYFFNPKSEQSGKLDTVIVLRICCIRSYILHSFTSGGSFGEMICATAFSIALGQTEDFMPPPDELTRVGITFAFPQKASAAQWRITSTCSTSPNRILNYSTSFTTLGQLPHTPEYTDVKSVAGRIPRSTTSRFRHKIITSMRRIKGQFAGDLQLDISPTQTVNVERNGADRSGGF